MSSFFRSVNDVSASGEETSESTSPGDEGEGRHVVLDRITTVSSETEVGEIPRPVDGNQFLSPYQERASWLPSGDAAGHQSFLLHALLEERCVNQALEHLNRHSQASVHFTRDDPEVQAQARQVYEDLCQSLIPKGLLPAGPEQDRFRSQRQGYRQGLNLLSRGLSFDASRSALSRSGSTMALPPALQRVFEGTDAPVMHGDSIAGFERLSLRNGYEMPSPFDTVTSHQMLDMSRYGNDFAETQRVGKGGYGEVFAVRHKISGVEYAIKKIPIGESRLRKIRERGQAELDALLNELRVLARLEHPNIVRYYNGWLETTPAPGSPQGQATAAAQQLLLLDEGHDFEFSSPSTRELHLETRKGSVDIVFEHSEAGVDPVVHFGMSESEETSQEPIEMHSRGRRETFSSTTSRKSTATKASVEDEEVVIDAPRNGTESARVNSTLEATSTDAMFSDLTSTAQQRTPSVLTLHLQMSLHPLTLADFLSYGLGDGTDNSMALAKTHTNPHSALRHCFHTVISILIVISLLEGVDYLHSEGLVHRDLKPANIFLTPSPRPAYSSVAPCGQCRVSEPLHLNVRIGDFGLVTAMADPDFAPDGLLRKAVGTQNYRPASNVEYAPGDARLDMYSIGVIFFELLWPFGTRMERHDALGALKNGALPHGFVDRLGGAGASVGQCILAMLDAKSRLGCSDAKAWLRKILEEV